jgi:serine/threonine protein kinase
MEYIEKGTLLKEIVTGKGFTEERVKRFFSEIFTAVEYLHENKIAHRDLKAENILIDANDHIRLIDFGLAIQYETKELFSTRCGSYYYLPPEILKGEKYTSSIDFWSLGVLLYYMTTCILPFQGKNAHELLRNICSSPPSFPSYLSKNLVDLLRGLLTINPKDRFYEKNVKESDWFNEIDYKISRRAFWEFSCVKVEDEKLMLLKYFSINIDKLKDDLKKGIYSFETGCYKQIVRQIQIEKWREIQLQYLKTSESYIQQENIEIRTISPRRAMKNQYAYKTRSLLITNNRSQYVRTCSSLLVKNEKLFQFSPIASVNHKFPSFILNSSFNFSSPK